MKFLLLAALLLQDRFGSITSSIEQGRYREAEQGLRGILQVSPGDLRALSLLGVVLDSQGRYREAEEAYLKAIKLAPDSSALLNNLGNHYLAQGDSAKARNSFEKVLAHDPVHPNANLQTAQLAVDQKDFAVALRCLDRLPKSEQQEFAIRLLRLRALWGSGQKNAAETLSGELEKEAASGLRNRFALALAFAGMERFAEAETSFSVVLQSDPANFDVLYNLGMSALRAGHTERANEVFQRALQIRPDDVDSLVGLSRARILGRRESQALPLLVRAHKLAQDRPDILLLMAQTSYNEGFFADTAIAYDKYLKLKPDDEIARRERGLALTRSFRLREGLKDLEAYVKKHPQDPWGYYKLAAAQSLEEKEQSLASINKALALSPQLKEARYARGLLLLQLSRSKEAVADFEAYLAVDPDNAQALEQMGLALLKLGQPRPAAEYLQKAIQRNPEDGNLYFHLSRALRALGRTSEVTEALARFQQLGGAKEKTVPAPGLFDYLSLSPEQRAARDEAGLKQAIENRPSDLDLKFTLAESLLRQNKSAEAVGLVKENFTGSLNSRTLARVVKLLVAYNQYEAALPLVETAPNRQDLPEDLLLDYVLARFHVSGAEAALASLEQVPTARRTGNYQLLRAQLLDEMGRFPEAVQALNEALRAAPDRIDLYLQSSQFLVKHERHQEAIDLLNQAERYIPNSRDLMMTRAIIMELLNHPEDAARELSRIQSLWPEWHVAYLTHGVILQITGKPEEARQLLQTAIALGARDPAAYYYLSQAMMNISPGDNVAAYKVVAEGLSVSPSDPYLQVQAGKLALAGSDYAKARQHLDAAIRLKPEMADAHWTLAGLFRAMGEEEKQLKALAEVERLNKLYPQGKDTDRQMRDLLFSLRFRR